MKTATILALIAGTASAFTTSNVKSSTQTALQAMDDMVGAVDLRGKEFKFDPVRSRSRHLCKLDRPNVDQPVGDVVKD